LAATVFIVASVVLIGGALALTRIKSKLYWQRWITWLVIAVAFASAYLLGQEALNVLVCGLAFVMMFELTKLLKLEIFSTTLVLLLTWFDLFQIIQGRSAAVFFWLLPVAAAVLSFNEAAKGLKVRSGLSGLYGALLISLSFVQLVQYSDKALALILTVACFDVASFIGGRTLGKLPVMSFHFSPRTSPNKTVGGLLGGSIALLLVLLSLGKLSFVSFGLVLVGAVLGDYLESWVKRLAGVKDAGSWLPGFGGFLDRFDSVLLLAPLLVFIF
jgi:phosphatidate cytidylyltransferase